MILEYLIRKINILLFVFIMTGCSIVKNNISNINQGSVTNVTDHWVMINLKGSKIYDLLSKSSPYDFKNFKMKKGSVAQTLLNHTDVILHNIDDNNLNLFVRRSFSEDLCQIFF